MAIQIDQEKRPINIISILMGFVVVASLFAGVYFFLFKRPELIDVVLPAEIQSLSAISSIPFDPGKIISSDKFRALQQHGGDVPLPQTGRANPFLP
ncbi:hypothetical protein A3A21_00770 [Candidatus Jorgensenbacteria bacterium RIFCSPLOWO2_01_FULL_45_25b]|uniref:Uncharacterized protein n=1 Tax=Candidatus Jorgensenbacteria bacterium RIFCSPLOWO2_01_FULL_45_25b TaxID=1798471 RepID=A0A1F6C065_9BACT|nr:MAG: hypothetical protein A3A21_00770 [Candidatus Jorgensenbacteria bacterium RIFCSPLOWO2_01_FULL_45_25b]